MKVCKRHDRLVIVYSSDSCPLCDAGEILEGAEQRMSRVIKMVNTLRRALDKNHGEYFTSTLDLAGNFIDQSREEVGRAMKLLSGSVPEEEPEGEE